MGVDQTRSSLDFGNGTFIHYILHFILYTLNFPTLVIGGGISGITAAVELAEAGKEVVLIEKEPYLGGNVS